MKDQEFKDIWRSLEDFPGMPIGGAFDPQRFISSRSSTIKDKVRKHLLKDLIIKMVSLFVILLNMAFYQNIINVLYVCFALLLFLVLMSIIEYAQLREFNRITDPSDSTRDNLFKIMVFLQRKSTILGIVTAASQVLIFIPGLLAYFFLVHGQLKPMTGMSFFVFSTFCLIGILTAYSATISQIKFHIKHLTIYMSDLNDSTLQMAYSTIEKDRKRDGTIKLLVGMLLIVGFTLIAGVLKSIMG